MDIDIDKQSEGESRHPCRMFGLRWPCLDPQTSQGSPSQESPVAFRAAKLSSTAFAFTSNMTCPSQGHTEAYIFYMCMYVYAYIHIHV